MREGFGDPMTNSSFLTYLTILILHNTGIFFFFNNFIFGCAGSSLLCGFSFVVVCGGYSLGEVCGLLTAAASLVGEKGVGSRAQASIAAACGLSNCSSRAPEHRINSCGTRA